MMLPLAIKIKNLLETCNKSKKDLDGMDMEYNINQVAKAVNLSP